MSSIVVGRGCAQFMFMLALALAAAAPAPAPAQTVLRGLAAVEQPAVQVQLADRGWQDGLQLRGHFDRRTVHLPTLQALGPSGGRLQLDLEASLPDYRFASLEIRVNGRSAAAVDLLQLGDGHVEAALTAADLAQPFVAVEAILRGSIAEDRCTDERIAGGFVTIRPTSSLVLATAPGSRPDIWQTIEALPRRVEIGIAGDASEPRLLAAALQTAATLTRAGHEPVFRVAEGASADRVFDLIALAAEVSPPDVVVGEPAMVRAALAAVNGRASEPIVPVGLGTDQGPGIASIESGGARAILAVTPEAASGLAALLGHGMAPLAAGAAAAVLPALGSSSEAPRTLPLVALDLDLTPRALADTTEWRLAVPVTRLPVGRVARTAVLDLMVPAGAGGEPLLATALVDGEMVGWWQFHPGADPVRLRVDLAPDGTRLVGDVRLQLQRQGVSSACQSPPLPVQADLLASSHLELEPLAGAPRSFAEFAAMAGEAVEIVVDRATLQRPEALLDMLTPVASQLFRPGTAIAVRAADHLERATGRQARLFVGSGFAASLEAPVPLGRPGLEIAAGDGERLLEIEPSESLAVLQLARYGDEPVMWLAASGGALPHWRPQRLDRETVLIGGAGGTRLGFNAETDRAVTVDHAAVGGWRARLGGGWLPVLALGWLLLTIGAVHLARRSRARAVVG